MKIAIVHYHLADGGVAEVIRNTCRMLLGSGVETVVLTGGPCALSGGDFSVRSIPGLGYGIPELSVAELIPIMRASAQDALGGAPDVWHFHNHSLGKNPRVPEIVTRLAADGERLLLHIHDLAEDGRPENARFMGDRQRLYPHAAHVHYAFLNSRDRERFIAAGLPPGRAHLLPNPVAIRPQPASRSAFPLMLAPVRGIRRKNLGELVLLASLAPAGTRTAITRAPQNPAALAIHGRWQNLAAELQVPIDFAVVDRISPQTGIGSSFEDWLAHATHIVSTSVSEGFGLPLIEALAWGRPLLGRRLAHLADLTAGHGAMLYDRLLVPSSWFDQELLRHHVCHALEQIHHAWRLPLPQDAAVKLLHRLEHHGYHDFGNLPEDIQRQVLHRCADHAEHAAIMVEHDGARSPTASWLAKALDARQPPSLPGQWQFDPTLYQEKLMAAYQILHNSAPGDESGLLAADSILRDCLAPENFHFLAAPCDRPFVGIDGLRFHALIFDIYGTLLIAPAGGVMPDPEADPRLREVLLAHGYDPPDSPSAVLHAAVLRHHQASPNVCPEVDLRLLWGELLGLPADQDTTSLVIAIERAWHPATPMPGAGGFIRVLSAAGIPLGLLSNAQCDTLPALGGIAGGFAPDLMLLSYQHSIAKPAPELFEMMVERLAARGIRPAETLFVGNDPGHDIVPAAAVGFRTALFAGHPDSLRPGECTPDFVFHEWPSIIPWDHRKCTVNSDSRGAWPV